MSLEMIEVELDRKRFHLGPISLSLPSGTWLSLVGESGSGKSTLLGLISGAIGAHKGRISIDGADVTHFPPEHRPCASCQQEAGLFPVYNVLDNLAFPLIANGHEKRVARDIARHRAADFRIPARLLEAKADQLSGGEARRVALGRAFLRPFTIACLDEVMAGLDEENQTAILRLLRETYQLNSFTVMFVSHDPAMALSTASDAQNTGRYGVVAVMKHGRLAQIGSAADVYHKPNSPYVAQLFGTISLLDTGKDSRLRQLGLVQSEEHLAIRAEVAKFLPGLVPADGSSNQFSAKVLTASLAGSYIKVELSTALGTVVASCDSRELPPANTEGTLILPLENLIHFTPGAGE